MKSYIAAAALFAAAASAQSISDLPSCSLSCLLTAVSATGCSTTDFKCSCSKSDQLTSSVEPCVQKACPSADDQAKVITVLEGICSSAGVPITIAAPGGATSSAAAPSSSAVAETSSAAASMTSSAAGYATASSSSWSSSSTCTTTAAYTTVTVLPTGGYPVSNGTVSGTPPPPFTGAAVANGVTFGAAGVAGVLAFFL